MERVRTTNRTRGDYGEPNGTNVVVVEVLYLFPFLILSSCRIDKWT